MESILGLKRRDTEFKYEPNKKEKFIRLFGSANCQYLTLKAADDVLGNISGEISAKNKAFIEENANKEILCCIIDPQGYASMYVFGAVCLFLKSNSFKREG